MSDSDVIPSNVQLREWDDVASKRQAIFDGVKSSLESQFPKVYSGVRMELHNTRYEGPEHFSLSDQKNAILDGKFLHRKLKGTVKLFDAATGNALDERDMTLMRVPFLTERHTFIHNGSEYSTLNQARLLPGVYTRRKASGELESHFNAKRGSGPSFRIRLEPESGLFKMDIGQSSLRLYSLLRDLGVPDEQLEKAWGPELLQRNREAYDVRVFDKAFQRLVRRPAPDLSKEQKAQAIRDALAQTKLSRQVLLRTLPNRFNAKLASEWRKQAFSNATSVSPTQAMKLGPRVAAPNRTDMVSQQTFNTDRIEDDHEERVNRSDYLLLAQLLNSKFNAHIPLDLAYDQLVLAIEQAMGELMPGVNKDMLRMAISPTSAGS